MRKEVLLALVGLFTTTLFTCGAEIFSTNSVWRFRRGSSEASSPTSAWRAANFNDAAFSDAPAPFWYGDIYTGGTQLMDMQNSYSCIFLRRTFVIANVQEISALRLGAFVDDGFIAWINGVEVRRVNVPAGQSTFQTLATNASEPPPFTFYNLPAPGSYLTAGTNVLAVQVFNTTLGSSDLGFDCALEATFTETNLPVITNVTPTPGTVSSLTSIAVTFSEAVAGVEADDFLVNGIPPDAISGGGSTYTFTFAQPLYGTVFITWAVGHGIRDLATPPNSFDATTGSATWQYELVDNVSPVVSNLHPPAGLTLRALSQIEVTFSEDVLGVQASDLLIDGQPATEVTEQPGGPFLFRFPARPPGAVRVAWASGHGITDAAAAPNPFAGGSWSYIVDLNAPVTDLVITEILTANVSTNGLADEDGEQEGWIEVHNRGTSPVNLANWSLSDDPDLPSLWTFPARTLAPNEYLVVFASGKDRKPTSTTGRLHTNFKLGDAGEHLALYTPDSPRVLASGFTPYPEQRNDVSYGLDSGGSQRYFTTPTPGQANGVSTIIGVCAPVHVNVSRGHFSAPFDLTLSCPTPGAQLRYTTDGSEPTVARPLFPASLRIASTTLFRAAAFKTNFLPSQTATHSYFFNLPASIRSLPVLSIVTASNNLYGRTGILGINGGNYNSGAWAPNPGATNDYHNPSKHGLAWERPTSVEWIRPEDNSGFQVNCGLRVQGSDYQRPRLTPTSKFSFRLYFRGDYGPGRLEYPLFPLTSVRRFDQLVLRAGFNEPGNPFIRDEIHRRLSHDMGQVASHGNLAIVFVNGRYYTSSPSYNPCERVHEEFLQEHLGGGDEWDVVGPTFAQGAGVPGVIDGNRADFQSLVNYVRTQTVTTPSVYQEIERRLDLTNFVDYCMLNAYAAMGDWPPNNWRAGRDRGPGGIWRFIVWDAEWGMGIYDRTVSINSFTLTGGGPNDSGLGSFNNSEIARMYDRLRANPEFRLLWADRVQKHFFNGGALAGANITNRFEQLRRELLALIPSMDIEILQWARDRQRIFFNQMIPYGLLASSNAPGFSQFGGRVPSGFNLIMTNLAGTIYYTTDGRDPRERFTSAVSPAAAAYTGPVPLATTTTVRARSLQGANWSALTEATFTVESLGIPLRVTEIMYQPLGGSPYEFIELQNTGTTPLDLSGMSVGGINFMFVEGSALAGGARLVLGSNTDTNGWKARYSGVSVAGWFGGNLNNAGERITLYDRNGNIITSVDYKDNDGWPATANGSGPSLEVINPNADPDDPANWQASAQTNGTPGVAATVRPLGDVRLNEVMADNVLSVSNGSTHPDWIELHNAGAAAVNLAGWSLSDSGNPRKFVFPVVTLNPGGYLVVWCDAATNATPGLHTGFALDREGDSVFLYDPNTNRVDAITFGHQLTDATVGRVNGEWRLTVPSPGFSNTAATLSPASQLVINEWMANPVPGQSDWIELLNQSASEPVALRGIYLGTSNRLHQITALSFVPPLAYLQLFADEDVGPDHLDFKLPPGGGRIVLYDETGAEVQRVLYGAQTSGVSQGRLPDGNSNVVSFPGSVSPAAMNYLAAYNGPVLNEVLARNRSVSIGGQVADFVELFNPSSIDFNLGGFSLSEKNAEAGEWIFPPNMMLPAGGYLVVLCDGSRPASTNAGSFNLGTSLASEGGGLYLFNAAGQLVNSVEYGFQIDDLSIGLSSGQWRLLSAPTPGAPNVVAATLGANTALRLNEWMANPSSGADWFEVCNLTNRPVDLSTLSLTDDPSTVGRGQFRPAPLSFIAARGFVKWVADADAGQGRNHVNFVLDAEGESIRLYNVSGTNFVLMDAVAFGAQTSGVSQGRFPDGADNVVMFPGSPTPSESNYRLTDGVVINEVLTHTDPPLEDAIELHNANPWPVNIGGWYLSNSRDNLRKYRIPDGTVIPANGFVVFYENQFNDGTTNGFGLSSAYGDEVWLSATDAFGNLTGDRAVARFGAAFNGVSFGRVVTSVGVDYAPLTQRTFGADDPGSVAQFRTGAGAINAAPLVGPVVINEILYHPPGGTNGSNEYIELHNGTGSTVLLYDPVYPTNRWKLGGAVNFTFPTNSNLAAGGYLLLVGFDPVNEPAALAAFRARYGISASVPVYGPFDGGLNNDEDSVELYRPDTPQQPPSPDAGFVPYVLVDRIAYTDRMPWPNGDVDGGGLSLQRRGAALYGNEPLNWLAAAPTPGAANALMLPDTDHDGIPDAIEVQMGLDPNNPADGAVDPDSDGTTNTEEYVAGTDHRDPNSYLKLDGIRVAEKTVLSFKAVSNRTYSVLYKDSLTDPVWRKLADVPAQPATQIMSVIDGPSAVPTRYYRLLTPAQ